MPTSAAETNPSLSVILVAGSKRERTGLALASLLRQSRIESMEIILVDLWGERLPPVPQSDHPRIRVLPVLQADSYGAAMTEGIRRARAPVVAFLEEHALACRGWAAAIIQAHEGPWDGVGCLVLPALRRNAVSQAMSLINDIAWSWERQRGEAEQIRGHNAAYKRQALLAFGDQMAEMLEFEAELHARLREQGGRLFIETGAKIVHCNDSSWRSMLRAYFAWNRSYAAACKARKLWSVRTMVAKVVGWPLSPPVRWVRTARTIFQTSEIQPAAVIRLAPSIFAAHLASSLGQLVGLIAGPGQSHQQFLLHELTADRGRPDWDWEAI